MTRLGALSSGGTITALECVRGTWVVGSSVSHGYLRRRNFHIWPLQPWLVEGMDAGTVSGEFPTQVEPDFAIRFGAGRFYVSRYVVEKTTKVPAKSTRRSSLARSLVP